MLNIFGVIVVILACTQAYILLNDNHNEEHKVKENKNYGSHSLDDGHGHAKEELETMTKHENIDKMLFEKMLQSLQNTKSSNLEEQKNIEKAIESMKKIKEENEEVHKGQNH